MAMNIMGFDSGATDSTPGFELGQRNDQTASANGWVYVLAGSGGLTAGYAAFINEDYSAVMITTSNGTFGGLVGVPAVDLEAGQYGWLQVFGNSEVQAAATVSADVQLSTTATPGELDDATTGGVKAINGMKLNTATTGAAGLTSCFLNYPQVGATLA